MSASGRCRLIVWLIILVLLGVGLVADHMVNGPHTSVVTVSPSPA